MKSAGERTIVEQVEDDEMLYEMGIKEKEHEVIFLDMIKDAAWLPYFERVFSWGVDHSGNDVELEKKLSVLQSKQYCRHRGQRTSE